MTNNRVFIIIHIVGYKERQPVKRPVIKHGKDGRRGIVDMSSNSLEAKSLEGGQANVQELLEEISQERPSYPKKRHKAFK